MIARRWGLGWPTDIILFGLWRAIATRLSTSRGVRPRGRAHVTRNTILLWERAGLLHPTLMGFHGYLRNMIPLAEVERLIRDRQHSDLRAVWGS